MLLILGCSGNIRSDGNTGKKHKPQPSDTLYTLSRAMGIYGYQPIRALQIIDSAVVVGNISELQADMCRARIYSFSLMKEQLDSLLGGPTDIRLDSALAIGKRILRHDSIKTHLELRKDVMEVLSYTARMKNDTAGWLQRSRELVNVCRQLGAAAESDALRTEAEIGAALYAMGQREQGMEKLDSVINVLSDSPAMKFSELDALIVTLRRKIVLLGSFNLYAETLPLARRIIELLDDYEAHPDAYHDGSHREPKNDQKRDDYIRFYRNQAQNMTIAAYASLGESGNMLEAFKKIEASVHEATAREHNARYHALEQEMKRQAAESHSDKMRYLAISTSAGLLFALLLAYYVFAKNRIIIKKNQGLIRLIDENIRLKSQPQSLTMKEGSGSSLFTRISTEIREQLLYLNPSFDRQAVCDHFHLNAMQVGNAFAQGSIYNSVAEFIRDCRLEHACQLLKTTDMKISDVAAQSGFSLVTTFNHDFKARFNLSPTEYRQQ